ncbi:MAG: hypothetical protein HZA34_01650 [Candidatus Pacebacteria bacterium]|nr:hypothetical protein [Candidatus Paceibacterota bacterium]
MRIPFLGHEKRQWMNPLVFFSVPMFFAFLADGSSSYIFPIVTENVLGSNFALGLVMASSSVAGILCDVLFPSLLQKVSWQMQVILGIVLSAFFPLLIALGLHFHQGIFFLIASIVWGVYYELLSFAEQNFTIVEEEKKSFAKVWGVLFAVMQGTGIVGPILGSIFLDLSLFQMTSMVLGFSILAFLFSLPLLIGIKNAHVPQRESGIRRSMKFITELRYWKIFVPHIMPAIIMGIWLESIEATFWTLGGLFGQSVMGEGFDWLPTVLYSAPLLLGSLLLTKLPIVEHKKRISQIGLLCAGIALLPLAWTTHSLLLTGILIFVSALALSFSGPLNEAVYSDLLLRSDNYKQDLLGLEKANSSLAYIFMPILIGIISDVVGYSNVFSLLGGVTVILSCILLVITPKKLKIPHNELAEVAERT